MSIFANFAKLLKNPNFWKSSISWTREDSDPWKQERKTDSCPLANPHLYTECDI